jgi:hypothetical protein
MRHGGLQSASAAQPLCVCRGTPLHVTCLRLAHARRAGHHRTLWGFCSRRLAAQPLCVCRGTPLHVTCLRFAPLTGQVIIFPPHYVLKKQCKGTAFFIMRHGGLQSASCRSAALRLSRDAFACDLPAARLRSPGRSSSNPLGLLAPLIYNKKSSAKGHCFFYYASRGTAVGVLPLSRSAPVAGRLCM